MKKLVMVLLLVILLMVSAACARAPEAVAPAPMPAPVPVPAPAPPVMSLPSKGGGTITVISEDRMIVRNGDIAIVVEDVLKARDDIARLAEQFGGFVVSSYVSGEELGMRGSITIRVEDDKFETALAEIRKLAVRVKSESTNSQDVTEQYTDLETRLKNAESAEKQYLAILERADRVEDILRVYDSLRNIRLEIEQIKTQMRNLERITSMSLISVQIEPRGTTGGVVRKGWSALEVLKSALRGLVTFGQVVGTVLIWMLIFSPLWGGVLAIVYWRAWRKKKKASS